ncbi:MAG: hypothetical protein N2689_09000 [Verrucomicrobiae bacterium]|nr:hypothetical protein [Verrucomicrobiae bacterium]
MPSVHCPKCQAENTYPAERAGNAMTCVKCGFAIPSQMTVLPTAKPKVKLADKKAETKDKEPSSQRVSFATRVVGRPSSTAWLTFGGLAFFLLLLIGVLFWGLHSLSGSLPPIKESPTPPARMTDLVISRHPPDYVVFFTLRDEKDVQIARAGRVNLTISEITHIGVAGSGVFDQENKLYEGSFEVDASHYQWYQPGGFFMPARLICATRVPVSNFKRPPKPGYEGRVTVKFYDRADPAKVYGLQLKFFFSTETPPAK